MDPFLGEIKFFAGNFAPRGWALCQGQLLSINQNQALFSILGTIYGGDGRTSFALPDLRGRAPIQHGNGPGLPEVRQGAKFGAYQTVLTVNNLPNHSHGLLATTAAGTTADPSNAILANAGRSDNEFATTAPNIQMASNAVGNTGGSQPINNLPPSLGLNAIIALQGTFPSRN